MLFGFNKFRLIYFLALLLFPPNYNSAHRVTRYNSSRILHKDLENYDQEEIAPKAAEADGGATRLSRWVVPKHYKIYLFPSFTEDAIRGIVGVQINLLREQNYVRIHAKNMDITETQLFGWDGIFIPVTGYKSVRLESWIIKRTPNPFFPNSKLPPGEYLLSLRFQGRYSSDLFGFYRSFYKDSRDNVTKMALSTNFEPSFARNAFPCFDEPGLKATFSIRLVKPSSMVALSNMPEILTLPATPWIGLSTVEFATSPPMSTYLVAVAVGDFAHLESRTRRGILVRIYVTSSSHHVNPGGLEYASSLATGLMDHYEQYFGILYPLPKLDLIGIPEFPVDGVENWGLISLREANLQFQPGVGSPQDKQEVTLVIAHELCHNWFGDLVTIKWWDDLWLNEGFSSRIENKGSAIAQPTWDMEEQFVSTKMTSALKIDGQASSRPILASAVTSSEIHALFDSSAYDKGASVIRMLENFMGPSSFQAGISSFLRKYAFGNADTQDLWRALQPFCQNHQIDISRVMTTWTRQSGYPLLTLEGQGSYLTLRQERFLSNGRATSVTSTRRRWEIPVGIQASIQNRKKRIIWMTQNSDRVTLPPNLGKSSWIKLNVGQFGFYRVQYPDAMYKIFKTVLATDFTPAERCGVIDDAFSLSFGGYLSYIVTLDFSRFLQTESHFIPWSCASDQVTGLGNLIKNVDPGTHLLYKNYVLNLVFNVYNGLSWGDSEYDNQLQRLLKPLIFSLACENGLSSCRDRSRDLFIRWISHPESPTTQIPPGLRNVVYQWGIYQSNAQVWEHFLELYIQELDPGERDKRLKALTWIQDKSVIKKFLEISGNESIIRRQDWIHFVGDLSQNAAAVDVVWDYYRANYPSLIRRFTLDNIDFGELIGKITSSFASRRRLHEMEDFFAKYPNPGAGALARKMALESVQSRIIWGQSSNLRRVKYWLTYKFGGYRHRHRPNQENSGFEGGSIWGYCDDSYYDTFCP